MTAVDDFSLHQWHHADHRITFPVSWLFSNGSRPEENASTKYVCGIDRRSANPVPAALMAVMRKMLAIAAHLLKYEEEVYDPSKICTGAAA
jgi:hypothetical protein